MLAAHLRRRGLTAADADTLLFVAPKGGPIRYDKWRRRVWIPACQKAGLAGLAFHDLRRVNATVLVAGGVNLKTAQTRLGHSDPRLTLAVYAQATGERDRSAANLLGDRLMPPPAANVRRRSRAKRAQGASSTTSAPAKNTL
ncbi:MAG: tyrosine-type recombinase/integrase [Acidimicrobiales bacterium]